MRPTLVRPRVHHATAPGTATVSEPWLVDLPTVTGLTITSSFRTWRRAYQFAAACAAHQAAR